MPDADSNKGFGDARATLRETSKWIVTILGASVVLVIGGGLIAKIADLDVVPRSIAAACLVALTMLCLWPLKAAIGVIANRLTPFDHMVEAGEYDQTRDMVDRWMAPQYPPALNTMEKLHRRHQFLTDIVNDDSKREVEKVAAESELDELQPRIREVMELANTQFLRLKFENLVRTTTLVLPGIGLSLFIFLVASHKEDATEKALAKPVLLSIPWSQNVEKVLKKAGMDERCYTGKDTPRFVQLSEKSGLRAGVLVVPRDLGAGCYPVRVIVSSTNEVLSDDR